MRSIPAGKGGTEVNNSPPPLANMGKRKALLFSFPSIPPCLHILAILSRRRHSIYHTPLVAVYQTGRKGFLWLAGEKEREGGIRALRLSPHFFAPSSSSFLFSLSCTLDPATHLENGGRRFAAWQVPKKISLENKAKPIHVSKKSLCTPFQGNLPRWLCRPPIPPFPSFRFLGVGDDEEVLLPSLRPKREERGISPGPTPRRNTTLPRFQQEAPGNWCERRADGCR